MKLHVVQERSGSRQLEVDTNAIESQQPSASTESEWTLFELKLYIAAQTNVSVDAMKLLHKGKTLTDDGSTLTDLKLKDGDKVMLLAGKTTATPRDATNEKLCDIEGNALQDIDKRASDLRLDLESVRQGYLSASQQCEVVRKAVKKRLEVNERCMRALETLDAVQLRGDNTTDEQFEKNRTKRKGLVRRVQEVLDQLDTFQDELNKMRSELQEAQSDQQQKNNLYPQL